MAQAFPGEPSPPVVPNSATPNSKLSRRASGNADEPSLSLPRSRPTTATASLSRPQPNGPASAQEEEGRLEESLHHAERRTRSPRRKSSPIRDQWTSTTQHSSKRTPSQENQSSEAIAMVLQVREMSSDREARPASPISASIQHNDRESHAPLPRLTTPGPTNQVSSAVIKPPSSPQIIPERTAVDHATSLVTSPVLEGLREAPSRRSSTRSIGMSIPRSARVPGDPPRRSSRRATSGHTSISPAHAFLSSWNRVEEPEEAVIQSEADDEGQSIGLNGEYIIGQSIGRGGFGVVKEVHSIDEHGQTVKRAAKIVRKVVPNVDEAENEKLQQQLEHEISVWRHLDNPHILRLHAVYDTDFATYCIMDLNLGGTLFDKVRDSRNEATKNGGRRGLLPTLAKRYAYQLACALRYLHEDIRVCHRDIKLENCLVDLSTPLAKNEGGNLRLCDFGLADFLNNDLNGDESTLDSLSRPTSSSDDFLLQTASAVIGTLEYASPKGLSVNRKLFETAGDVWAFGVVVYALCTGVLPFKHAMPSKTAELILHAEWDGQALRDAAAGGNEVIDLVKGCLEKDIDRRFAIRDALASSWFDDCRTPDGDIERRTWRR